MNRTLELVQELRGDVCCCGESKMEGESFCHACYYSLPRAKRAALYRRIGQGYEQAYTDAVVELSQRKPR